MTFRQAYINHRATAIAYAMFVVMFGILPLFIIEYAQWWLEWLFWFNIIWNLIEAAIAYKWMRKAKRYIIFDTFLNKINQQQ